MLRCEGFVFQVHIRFKTYFLLFFLGDKHVVGLLLRLDYSGIAIFIMVSFIPPLYYGRESSQECLHLPDLFSWYHLHHCFFV